MVEFFCFQDCAFDCNPFFFRKFSRHRKYLFLFSLSSYQYPLNPKIWPWVWGSPHLGTSNTPNILDLYEVGLWITLKERIYLLGAGFSHIKFIYQANSILHFNRKWSGAVHILLSHENCSLNYACSCNSLSFKFDQSPLGCQKLCKKKVSHWKACGE